jgi:hypothetical protein
MLDRQLREQNIPHVNMGLSHSSKTVNVKLLSERTLC